MKSNYKRAFFLLTIICFSLKMIGQNTKIRGFADLGMKYENEALEFVFGEYDLFITSQLTEHVSFLGETVFVYNSETEKFEIGVERVIINYNYKGNHSFLIGKHHTPINYWNDTYHHGRVFFPTIERPLLFAADIIPIHTTGIAFRGINIGKLRFGYNIMIGNGLGSGEVKDNDKHKSLTAVVTFKPVEYLKIGFSLYSDIISEGAKLHHGEFVEEEVKQKLYSGSVSYFGSKYELLAEGTIVHNKSESAGNNTSYASYLYSGVRINDKWIPYLRFDHLKFQDEESYLGNDDSISLIAGLRYEVNHLMALKLEFQHKDGDISGITNILTTQIAIGF